MITGSCLCGSVRFEIQKVSGPFELCHCRRCRKVSGSAFLATLYVRPRDFHYLAGEELLATYEAPILRSPPPYAVSFCRRCGSSMPIASPDAAWCEVPAGLLDDDPGVKADKHIFVEFKARWFEITDALPRYDQPTLAKLRAGTNWQNPGKGS